MSEPDDPYASPPPGWQPPAPPPPPPPSPSPHAPPSSWQPQQPPYAAPPGWQPAPPPYAAPPGWQPPPPPYGPPGAHAMGAPQQPYGAPGYSPYGYQAPGTTNGFAIASLACAIVLGIVPFLGGLLGVVFGIIGVRQTAAQRERGRGLAIAGIVIGGLAIVFWILAIIGLAVGGGSSSSDSSVAALSSVL